MLNILNQILLLQVLPFESLKMFSKFFNSHCVENLCCYSYWFVCEHSTVMQWNFVCCIFFLTKLGLSYFPFNWSILGLQYCISSRYVEKWFSYIYIFRLFSIIGYYEILSKYIVNPCCLPVFFFCIFVWSVNPQLLIYPSQSPFPLW